MPETGITRKLVKRIDPKDTEVFGPGELPPKSDTSASYTGLLRGLKFLHFMSGLDATSDIRSKQKSPTEPEKPPPSTQWTSPPVDPLLVYSNKRYRETHPSTTASQASAFKNSESTLLLAVLFPSVFMILVGAIGAMTSINNNQQVNQQDQHHSPVVGTVIPRPELNPRTKNLSTDAPPLIPTDRPDKNTLRKIRICVIGGIMANGSEKLVFKFQDDQGNFQTGTEPDKLGCTSVKK